MSIRSSRSGTMAVNSIVPRQIGNLPRMHIPNEHLPLPDDILDLLFNIYETDFNIARHSPIYRSRVHHELNGVLDLLYSEFHISRLGARYTIKLLREPLTLHHQAVIIDQLMRLFATVHETLQQNFTFHKVNDTYGYVRGTQLFEAVNTLLHHLEDVKKHLAYAAEASSTRLDPHELHQRVSPYLNLHSIHRQPPGGEFV